MGTQRLTNGHLLSTNTLFTVGMVEANWELEQLPKVPPVNTLLAVSWERGQVLNSSQLTPGRIIRPFCCKALQFIGCPNQIRMPGEMIGMYLNNSLEERERKSSSSV